MLEAYLRTSGPSVGPAQVAALIKERCGDELVQRAKGLRDDAAAPPKTKRMGSAAQTASRKVGNASDSGSGARMVVDGRPTPARRGLLWMVAAALLGAALGVGVLSYVRSSRRAKTAALQAAAAAASARAAQEAASIAASAAVVPAAAAQARVHLRITPDSAVVIIDGVVLPRGTDTITKPRAGATMNVLVRADKHEDTIVMVDSATPDEVEVALVPSAVGVVAPVATVRPRRILDAGVSREPKEPKDPPPIDAPPNPYE